MALTATSEGRPIRRGRGIPYDESHEFLGKKPSPLMRPFPLQSDCSSRPPSAGIRARLGAVRVAAVAVALLASWSASSGAIAATTDYFSRQVPRAAVPGRVTPQYTYIFGEPAYWPAPLHWRYNPAGAPPQLSGNRAATIQQMVDASAKWTAACGVQIIYDGETGAAPAALANGLPDRASVIGWQVPDGGYMAATLDWTGSDASGDTILVDSDISISPTTVTTTPQSSRRSSPMNGDTRSDSGTRLSRTP